MQAAAATSGFPKHLKSPQKAGIPPAQESLHTQNSPTLKTAKHTYTSTLILTMSEKSHKSTVQK